MKRLRGFLVFALAGTALWAVLRTLMAIRNSTTTSSSAQPESLKESLPERRSEPDPAALSAMTSGSGDRIGLDLERLRQIEESQHKPVVQYLTAIQVKRGELGESLLFVRQRDLDALAELSGDSPEGFVEQFRELGIIMSMN